jgi:hypothetical protein
MPAKSLCLVALLASSIASAQEASPTDTTPFRRGQWAAEFGGGASFVSLGVLRFRSPTSARVIDLSLQGFHQEVMTDSAFAGLTSQAAVSLRLGARRYHTVARGVAAHHTVGVASGFTHNVNAFPGGSVKTNGWNVGVFGEAGGSYLISPSFSIGASAGVSLRYSRTSSKASPGSPKLRSWVISGGASVTFSAAIYF